MNLPKKEKFITDNEALAKIYSFCAYQERCQKEVREKLSQFKLKTDVIEEIIAKLIQENYLNEERFAKLYAGGKFRIKKWGKRKIVEGLKQKNISSNLIKIALQEIPQTEYEETLKSLVKKQLDSNQDENPLKRNHKVAQYLAGRGYEPELIWDFIK